MFDSEIESGALVPEVDGEQDHLLDVGSQKLTYDMHMIERLMKNVKQISLDKGCSAAQVSFLEVIEQIVTGALRLKLGHVGDILGHQENSRTVDAQTM
jgi:hypothetical protein